jgi:putative ABC transport system substrate-binding protein
MERMPELVDDLLRQENVELLLVFGEHAAAAAARATRTVPIVFFNSYLPVECGLVDSYAKPGRNCTGTAWNTGPEVVAKRLEYLRAIAPSATRLVSLGADSRNFTLSGEPLLEHALSAVVAPARALGFDPVRLVVRRIEDVGPVLAEAIAARAQVVSIGGEHFNGAVPRIVDTALSQRWITATNHRSLFDAGLLLYHGPSDADFKYTFERGLQMADRILRGARPADIPVELPSRQEFALNLRTARALGLTLPQSLVLRADRVVE